MFVVISVIAQMILIVNSKYVVVFGAIPSLFSILFKKKVQERPFAVFVKCATK